MVIRLRIEIRSDSVIIDGYVNAVERYSNPVITPHGKVLEIIEQRAFEKALERAENIDLLLNHDKTRKLGSTKDGNLELWEDNIGLRAICTISDSDVIQKAKDGKLKGWSFGMYTNTDELENRSEGLPVRRIKDLDLFEVSIIDSRMNPCYTATSIETRAEGEKISEQRASCENKILTENMVETPKETIDYSEFEKRISNLKVDK